MHPAPSMIIFTCLSGLGFGLLFWLGAGALPYSFTGHVLCFGLAFLLCSAGLLASVFHLGNPKNALKSFSQWQTSWLSREGICAIATLTIMAIYSCTWMFLGEDWWALRLLGAFFALMTVFTTSMIYAQLATVPRWNTRLTPLLFLCLALAGGSLLLGLLPYTLILLILGSVIQLLAWLRGDRRFKERGSSLATATGLGSDGQSVRLFESPHTGSNYLLKEMVFVLAREHKVRLRLLGFFLTFCLPIAILVTRTTDFAIVTAVLSHIAGLLITRWLFFAEAEHVVGLYYGKR